REAIDELRDRSGVPTHKQLELHVLPRKLTLLQLVLRSAGSLIVEPVDRKLTAKQQAAEEALPLVLDQALSRLPLSILFVPQDKASTIMPGEIEVE
ncbi:MAG TPA: hypothetical protein VM869_18650, partial [Enhygromyxa sp.]|nr:hypothetical protein [Enhygromyxa sp.]